MLQLLHKLWSVVDRTRVALRHLHSAPTARAETYDGMKRRAHRWTVAP